MDSSGIGLILGRYKKVNKVGGQIAIINTNPQVGRIMDISGLKKVIKFFKSVEEAIKEFEGA